jgi:hypothetical protein
VVAWLIHDDFEEDSPPVVGSKPTGRRFTKAGETKIVVDLFGPDEFAGLGDHANFDVFQSAIKEHEVVVYDGHSMLGASDFWSRPEYPDTYQIFLYGGCLGYQYYIRPILKAKGGWEKLDLMSSVEVVSSSVDEFAKPVLQGLFWGVRNMPDPSESDPYLPSWNDMMRSVNLKIRKPYFGVSGVRDNCFTPAGSQCASEPEPPQPPQPQPPIESKRYATTEPSPLSIDDGETVSSRIEVPDAFEVSSVTVELDLTHTAFSDLVVTLQHDGERELAVWDKMMWGVPWNETLVVNLPEPTGSAGTWTLRIKDQGFGDSGMFYGWTLVMKPSQ